MHRWKSAPLSAPHFGQNPARGSARPSLVLMALLVPPAHGPVRSKAFARSSGVTLTAPYALTAAPAGRLAPPIGFLLDPRQAFPALFAEVVPARPRPAMVRRVAVARPDLEEE